MSQSDRKAMIEPCPAVSLSRQCQLLQISRSSFYYQPVGESPETLGLMRQIDQLYMHYPFYGARQMVRHLTRDGFPSVVTGCAG